MALNLAPLATQANALFDNLPTTMTIDELWRYKQLGYELGVTNYDALEAKIQVHLDNAANLNSEELAILRMLTWPVKPIIEPTVEIDYIAASTTVNIPFGCHQILVSFQAAGGSSGNSINYDGYTNATQLYVGGGGGGGAAVFEYPIAVTPGSSLTLTKGNSLTIANLTVEAGSNGANCAWWHTPPPNTVASGGRVLINGVPLDNGTTAVAGGQGSHPVYNIQATGTTNGKTVINMSPRYDSPYSDPQTSNYTHYRGGAGGASPSSNGEQAQNNTNSADTRPVGLGAGASSHNAIDSGNAQYDSAVLGKAGGGSSPVVEIKYIITG